MRFFFLFIGVIIYIFPAQAHAQTLSMSTFQSLPIQHEGRIKPLKSFARTLYQQVDIQPTQLTATEFLAEALFNPAKAIRRPLFRIRSHTLKSQLSLDTENSDFSLTDLLPSLFGREEYILSFYEKDSLSNEEHLLLSLYERALNLHQVTSAFSAFLPLNIHLPEDLQNAIGKNIPAQASFFDYKRHEETILEYIKSQSSPDEDLTLFVFQLSGIEHTLARQQDIRLIPNPFETDRSAPWLSPAGMMIRGEASPGATTYLNMWKDMATAYRAHNIDAWNKFTQNAYEYAHELAPEQVKPSKLSLEIQYLQLNPSLYTVIFCFIALGVLAISSVRPNLPFFPITFCLLGAAFLFHTTGLGMRMALLERPPVTNLYESILFVNAIILGSCLFSACIMREKRLFLFIGALCGTLLFFTARFFAARGDTLEVLIAVLDTNFWLATHVLIITTGYGTCLLTSCIAHYMLYQRAISKHSNLLPVLHIMAIISLMLTTTGTILGGIWADQSWGRFWGWDPKENGALLIVLWLIWILHARLSGHLNREWYLAGCAALSIVVALAWFGINLLGIGLHSYGFTSGIAWGLGLFCGIETAFILTLALLKKKDRNT